MICNSGRKCIESFVWVLWEKLHSHFNLLITWICFCYIWEKSKNFIWHLHKKRHHIIIPGHQKENFEHKSWHFQFLCFQESLLLSACLSDWLVFCKLPYSINEKKMLFTNVKISWVKSFNDHLYQKKKEGDVRKQSNYRKSSTLPKSHQLSLRKSPSSLLKYFFNVLHTEPSSDKSRQATFRKQLVCQRQLRNIFLLL